MPHRFKLAMFSFIIVMTSVTIIFADTINWSEHQIVTGYKNFAQMDLRDVDGDSDIDLVTGSCSWGNGKISWWENDGQGVFTEHNLGASEEYRSVFFRDMNGDGAIDILNHIGSTHTLPFAVLVWINDGNQVFTRTDVFVSGGIIFNIDPVDMDGDGDQDVVVSHNSPEGIYWLENEGGLIFTEHLVDDLMNVACVRAGDLDGDGDQDIFGESYANNEVAWWENDGSESFSKHPLPTLIGPHNFHICDLDADGDTDVVMGTWGEGLVWLDNDGSASFTVHQISDTLEQYASVDMADLDEDGDNDVAATTSWEVLWYENDGSLNFTSHLVRSGMSGARGVHADYIDSDLKMDLVAIGYYQLEMSWWQQQVTPTISANLSCVPSFGTLPFNETLTMTVTNLDPDYSRRADMRLDLRQANGQFYSNWRRGYANIAGGSDFTTVLVEPVPNIVDLVGDNTVHFVVEDVTPSPYNQPPYLPAGDTDTDACTVTGYTP